MNLNKFQKNNFLFLIIGTLFLFSCKKEDTPCEQLIGSFKATSITTNGIEQINKRFKDFTFTFNSNKTLIAEFTLVTKNTLEQEQLIYKLNTDCNKFEVFDSSNDLRSTAVFSFINSELFITFDDEEDYKLVRK